MSEQDAVPLPREGEVFFDVRGEARCMRLSWYADSAVAVFSIWQGNRCTGTFRLPFKDLDRMARALQSGPGGPAVTGQPDLGYLDRDPAQGYGGVHGHRDSPAGQHHDAVDRAAAAYATGPFSLPDYDPPNYGDSPWQAGSPTAQPALAAEPRYAEPSYPAEPRYGYPAEPRYAGSAYPADSWSAEPGIPAEAGYQDGQDHHAGRGYHAGQGYPSERHQAAHASRPVSPGYPPSERMGSYALGADAGEDVTGLRAASAVYTGHVSAMAAPVPPSAAWEEDGRDLASDWSAAGYPPERRYPAPPANSAADSGRSAARYAGP